MIAKWTRNLRWGGRGGAFRQINPTWGDHEMKAIFIDCQNQQNYFYNLKKNKKLLIAICTFIVAKSELNLNTFAVYHYFVLKLLFSLL